MAIEVGDRLPGGSLLRMGEEGPERVDLGALLRGRKVVIFGVPGAFTSVCTTAHVPSFIRTRDKFAAKGVDDIICVAVNDPQVIRAWSEATGAGAAGITMLGDADSSFTKAIGMDFTVPDAGFFNRSKRYALYAEDGIVKVLQIETSRKECTISGGESLLEAI